MTEIIEELREAAKAKRVTEEDRRYFWLMLAILSGTLALGILIGMYCGG